MDPQILSAIRIVVMLTCSSLATKGLLTKETASTLSDPETITALVEAAVALGAAIWGLWSRRPHGIIKDAAALPQVDVVVVKPKTASEIPVANVVGSVTEASRLPGVTN